MTVHKGIPNISRDADAEGDMISHFTVCIIAAKTRAWINAFLILACFVNRTIKVELAFWPAVRRLAYHARLTGAVAPVTIIARRIGVGATGIRVAWIFFYHRLDC